MPTGKRHYRSATSDTDVGTPCRCAIGEDHDEDGARFSEALSPNEANDIYMSSGMDEDYDFR